jgi:Arc/MetJ-type ribon-helix-helix transcriptional regulator
VKGKTLMTMTVEIPDELQSLVAAVVASGRFANEQELVAEILRVAVPVLDDYERLRNDVATSVDMADRGGLREADFDQVRRQLCVEYDEAGKRK